VLWESIFLCFCTGQKHETVLEFLAKISEIYTEDIKMRYTKRKYKRKNKTKQNKTKQNV
jgi:hypothetical protein